jgi:hypothetical protein
MRPIALALCLSTVLANAARAGVGVAGADILKVPVEARGWGLGTAYSAIADDVGAMAYNPAGLGLGQRPEARLTHLTGLEGSSFNSLLVSYPAARFGSLGFMLLAHHVPEIDNQGDEFYPLQGLATAVSVQNWVFGFYGACRFSHLIPSVPILAPLSLGFGIKFLRLGLANLTANATASDIGLLLAMEPYIFGKRRQLRTALALQNLGGGFAYPGATVEADALPHTLRAGVAVMPYEDSRSSLCVSLDNASYIAVRSRQKLGEETLIAKESMNLFAVGAEYWRLQKMAARIGYVLPWGTDAEDYESSRGVALGGTFRIFTRGLNLQFDLAYRPIRFGSGIQDAVSISAGIQF